MIFTRSRYSRGRHGIMPVRHRTLRESLIEARKARNDPKPEAPIVASRPLQGDLFTFFIRTD